MILACRDLERAERARAEIVLETANRNVVVKLLDLASMGSIRAFAKDVNASKIPSFFVEDISASSTGFYFFFFFEDISFLLLLKILLVLQLVHIFFFYDS